MSHEILKDGDAHQARIIKAMEGAKMTFDPLRCNHAYCIDKRMVWMPAADCPNCLRYQLAKVEEELAKERHRYDVMCRYANEIEDELSEFIEDQD